MLGGAGDCVVGCAEDECHYVSGSLRCGDVIEETRELLSLVGIEPGRLGFELLSEVDGGAFAETVSRFAAGVDKMRQQIAGERA